MLGHFSLREHKINGYFNLIFCGATTKWDIMLTLRCNRKGGFADYLLDFRVTRENDQDYGKSFTACTFSAQKLLLSQQEFMRLTSA